MSYAPKQSLQEGFEKFVVRKPEGCWDWKGCCAKPGYGQFRSEMKIYRCHRASWLLHKGEIPEGYFVCHHCDNKRCSNPDHLFLGTCKENNLDAIKKDLLPIGRSGERNPNCKLSEDRVREIRKMCKTKMTQREIAKLFGISQATVSAIKINKLWRVV